MPAFGVAKLDDAAAEGAKAARDDLAGVRARIGFPEAVLRAEEEGPRGGAG